MNAKILSMGLSFLLLLFIVEMVREERLTFKYALGWILVSISALMLALFERGLFAISSLLGFELPSNFIFFGISCGLIFLSLVLTMFLCQQNKRNDKIAQELGLLKHELSELKKARGECHE